MSAQKAISPVLLSVLGVVMAWDWIAETVE